MKSDLDIAEYWYNELIEGLMLVASPFDIQERVLPYFVHLPDELLNSLPMDSLKTLRKHALLSVEEYTDIMSFDSFLDKLQLPSEYDEMLELVRSGQEFETARTIAMKLLALLGHEYREPKINATYVRSS